MLRKWYRKWIGRFVFRKLNLGIGLSLLIVFVLLGFVTLSSYSTLLEEREQDLLNMRTSSLHRELTTIITQFKRETITLYPLNNETLGSYDYFLPQHIPDTTAHRERAAERNYFSGLQSYMLERNPHVLSSVMYRTTDDTLFIKSRYPSLRLDANFDFKGLFASLPKDYHYPYIGKLEGLFVNADRPMIYVVSPIFDFAGIHYDEVYGYFMFVIDSRTLINLFKSDGYASELIIKKGSEILLDSREEDGNIKDMLSQSMREDRYDLEVIGMTDKAVIQDNLSQITWFIFGGLLLVWLFSFMIIHYILSFVIRRLKKITQHFKKVQTNPFTDPMEKLGDDEIGDLIDRFNRMTSEIQKHIKQVYIAEMQKSKAEFMALKMQINPHFLYNTLESLRMQAIIHRQPVLADKLFYLGKLYRWILKADAEDIPIEEEIQYTSYYLDLYMMGKSKRIELEVESEYDLSNRFMPKFSLQPIVENAILHGQLEQQEEPMIRVKIEETAMHQVIEIWNNGDALSPADINQLNKMLQVQTIFKNDHLGLKNIYERIRSYYGNEYGLYIPKTEAGFSVRMLLPKPRPYRKEEQHYA